MTSHYVLVERRLFCNSYLTEEEGIEKFDYLFIDEAGQVSVANLVGMSRIAKNIILMGDQMQLGQSQGSHPDESGQSILDYLLQDQATISSDMNFLQNIQNAPRFMSCSLKPSL